jgi:hypothetical protein
MSMKYEELDQKTRGYMSLEFESEENSGMPFRSQALSPIGLKAFPKFMLQAIQEGNEETLFKALILPDYWIPYEEYVRNGEGKIRNRNIQQATQRLALTEFSTWYVRGLAKRLLVEGIEKCQVYRGEIPKWEPGECSIHEGMIVSVQIVYDGHRAKYWPKPGNPTAFSIPFGPGCHHVIRRINN